MNTLMYHHIGTLTLYIYTASCIKDTTNTKELCCHSILFAKCEMVYLHATYMCILNKGPIYADCCILYAVFVRENVSFFGTQNGAA